MLGLGNVELRGEEACGRGRRPPCRLGAGKREEVIPRSCSRQGWAAWRWHSDCDVLPPLPPGEEVEARGGVEMEVRSRKLKGSRNPLIRGTLGGETGGDFFRGGTSIPSTGGGGSSQGVPTQGFT
mmetsp:Transcript_45802/g.114826  ORF Transcript_45802/g.114826 Transcript_45802/m.114826 type:complete len:125 (+) Transcript_45802:139-513(+)